jgi:uncharacterized integral membrane protein
MMRFLRLLVIAVIALVLLWFAFANRQPATVSLDPFGIITIVALPLFIVVIAAAMLGVIAGAAATWVSQGRHRRAARSSRVEADRWRAEAQSLRASQSAPPPLRRS